MRGRIQVGQFRQTFCNWSVDFMRMKTAMCLMTASSCKLCFTPFLHPELQEKLVIHFCRTKILRVCVFLNMPPI